MAEHIANKVTVPMLADLKARGERIVMVTAYDAPSARFADDAGIDVVLVGDSAGTTVLGGSSTVPVTMDEMLLFTREVVRGVVRALGLQRVMIAGHDVGGQVAYA